MKEPSTDTNDAELDRAKNEAQEAIDSGDYQTAFSIYKKFAEEGHEFAQLNLAAMYHDGKGTPKNYGNSFKWCSLAARQGHAKAQYNLGLMYKEEIGVSRNDIKAYMWFSIAMANGIEEAKEMLDGMEYKLNTRYVDVIEAQELAKQCWESNYQNCEEE